MTRIQKNRMTPWACLMPIAFAMGLVACGGGGSSTTAATTTTTTTNSDGETVSSTARGLALPTEISAVPTSITATSSPAVARGFYSSIRSLSKAASTLGATTDYQMTKTKKFVNEQTLEQFSIIEDVMSALSQTHYADEAVINKGPYKAMIAWEDEKDGREIKTLEPWVIDSRMIVINGKDVNRILVWIEELDDMSSVPKIIRAEFKIHTAATANADGSFADYGEWDMNVSMDAEGNNFFAASARIVGGATHLKVHEKFSEGSGPSAPVHEVKGLLVRSGTSGYGKVEYPDREWCWKNSTGPSCTPPVKKAKYAYNSDFLGIQETTVASNGVSTDDTPVYKDRNLANAVAMTQRYGLFDAVTGADVEKTKSFGFPVSYTDANGNKRFSYYGAWQGRHQLWGDDIVAGTTVTRQDKPGASAETYTVSPVFNGTLTKRILIDGVLDDIKDIPVETYLNKHLDLTWDASANGGLGAWMYCAGFLDFQTTGPAICRDKNKTDIGMSMFSDFASLVMASTDRKFVNIGRNNGGVFTNYVYLATNPGLAGYTDPGFYEASMTNGSLAPVPSATKFSPTVTGEQLFIDINGSIYIQYTGDFTSGKTGWVQKKLTSFENWQPVFDDAANSSFSPDVGREYYVNSRGANYVVKRIATNNALADYEVKLELQTAANPTNFASVLPTGTSYLRTPWRKEVTFMLNTTPSSANFLKVMYASDDPNTANVNEATTPTVLSEGQWGLQAFTNNGTPTDFSDDAPLDANGFAVTVDGFGIPTTTSRPVEFNWEYSADGGWGTQRYLIKTDGTYKLLDDPIRLASLTVSNKEGVSKNLSLQFDGWMHGLPDMYYELSKNDYMMTTAIANKVINIAEGTELTDASDSTKRYYIKPLEMSLFLAVVPGTTTGIPALTTADSADLTTVPNFTAHLMGAIPAGTVVKYSEGKLVE